MKHVVVIGGGFAGAAAASALAESGLSVTLLEQRSTLGGRTSSLRDGRTGEEMDNGQHLFLGCYRDTRKFLRRLKVEDRLAFVPVLQLPFRSSSGGRAELKCASLPSPWGLVSGLLGFQELSVGNRLALLRSLVGFKIRSGKNLASLTVSQWLDRLRQPAGARRAFWTPLCLATLNEAPERACAEALAVVLREAFLGKSQDMMLGYSTMSLGKLWSVELKAFLKRQGGTIAHRQTVTRLEVKDRRVARVFLESGESVEADAVVSAVPLPAFLKFCPEELRETYEDLHNVTHSAILSVNLWFSKPLFNELFVGLLDTHFQWAFNRHRLWQGVASPGYVSLVLSGANGAPLNGNGGPAPSYDKMTHDEIIALAMQDLKRCFPSLQEDWLSHASVLWEKQATPSPTPANWKRRPPISTPLENFFLAGDWVNTGLPATIEAASRSGHLAAAAVKGFLGEIGSMETVLC